VDRRLGRGPPVHGGPGRVGRVRGAGGLASRGGAVCLGGGAMAGGDEVGATALRGTTDRGECTGARRAMWRAQRARWQGLDAAERRGPRGGA